MYAAAGGASLASRQARQRQRQQKKTQQLQAKLHPPKALGAGLGVGAGAEHGAVSTPTRQSRQFHQLPTNYLRTPQAQARKLSASYTAHSKLLLPIDEGDTQSMLQLRMHSHAHAHAHMQHSHGTHVAQAHHQLRHSHMHKPAPLPSHYSQFASQGRVSPKLVHRHSGSSSTSFQQSHLPKSATATLPLVSQMELTPPTTPSGAVAFRQQPTTATLPIVATTTTATTLGAAIIAGEDAASGGELIVPTMADGIIVTPATPIASPGHVAKLRPTDDLPAGAAEKQPLTATDDAYDDDEPMQPPTGPLERKCSVYRMRRSDAFEPGEPGVGLKRQLRELQFNQQQQYEPLIIDEPQQLVFKGLPNGRKWQLCAYCEEGICVCEHIEIELSTLDSSSNEDELSQCAQGRAAWLERGRRCSVQEQEKQAACHRRWVKRNRIQDASLGGSSDDEDFLGVLRGPSTFANAFLYVGLGTVALGLVIAFVGTGEKGFKTVELRLIGPSLIVIGLVCCILRILFCICPSHCISSNKKTRKKNGNKVDADHTTSLLRGESKRVSIARGPVNLPKYPITHKRSQSKMLNEGMEALRQIATTSLFMQNEQKPSMNRVVPIIKEPDNKNEASLELRKLETSHEEDEDAVNEAREVRTANESQQYHKEDETQTSATTTAFKKTRSTTNSNNNNSTKLKSNTSNENAGLASNKFVRQPLQSRQNEPAETPKFFSSFKDSFDADDKRLTETSLIVLQPPHTAAATLALNETHQRPLPPTTTASVTTSSTRVPTSCSVDAIPRLKRTAFTTPVAESAITGGDTMLKELTTPAELCSAPTGTISRISTSISHPVGYDLPPTQPHTYATATVRGPLGMPLSALTGSYSSYTMPTMSSSSSLPASATTTSIATTATKESIAITTGPTPPTHSFHTVSSTQPTKRTQTSAAAVVAESATLTGSTCIPGQVLDMSTSSTSTLLQQRLGDVQAQIATTSLSIYLPCALTAPTLLQKQQQQERPTSLPPHRVSQEQPLSSPPSVPRTNQQNFYNASIRGGPAAQIMPVAKSKSQPSSASSMGHSTAPSASGASNLLAPPSAPPSNNKFEPELVLSPAKLGQ